MSFASCLFTIIVLMGNGFSRITSSAIGDLTEYCSGEIFKPLCENDEVIIMTEANFGRVRIGKCAKRDYGITGCYNNELKHVDKLCSGRRDCEIIVPDIAMKQRLGCLEDLSAHFIAGFICQPVFIPGMQTCRSQQNVRVSKGGGYLSSRVTMETSCGLHDTAWVLNTDEGQQIELVLIDFSWTNDTDGACTVNYGYLLDAENDDVVHICGGHSRKRILYLSRRSRVQVILQEFVLKDNNFLIEYKAVGCPHYPAPVHTWQERVNDTLTVGCDTDSQTWKLTCIDHIWLGHVGNCSKVTTTSTTVVVTTEIIQQKMPERMTFPNISTNHVIIFTMGCGTLLACCCIIVVGVYYTKRCDMEIKSLKNPVQTPPAGFGDTMQSRKSVIAYRAGQQSKEDPPTYTFPLIKEQRPPPVPHRTSTYRGGDMTESMMSDYLAPQGGDDATYYILENLEEMSGKVNKQ